MIGGDFLPAERCPLPEIQFAVAPASSAPVATLGEGLAPKEKAAALAALEEQCVRECQQCSLGGLRNRVVFGEGDPGARLVFVGEAPGEEEDRQGRPFVGRAGELLTKMILAMGLKREQVYICNMLKCRPPNNRAPNPEEIQACWGHLVRQLEILRPEVIVTLGNPATQNLLNTRVGITRLRGTWQKLPAIGQGLEGIPVMPTFHPSYVLRTYTAEVRGKVWDDLQKVMEKLGMKKG